MWGEAIAITSISHRKETDRRGSSNQFALRATCFDAQKKRTAWCARYNFKGPVKTDSACQIHHASTGGSGFWATPHITRVAESLITQGEKRAPNEWACQG